MYRKLSGLRMLLATRLFPYQRTAQPPLPQTGQSTVQVCVDNSISIHAILSPVLL
jgi:hypothetical protein